MSLASIPLAGRRIIIVEDEPLVSMLIEEMAGELDLVVAGTANNEIAAFDVLGRTTPDIAVLDIQLSLTTSFQIAAACRDRGIPVLFITGYSAGAVPDGCRTGTVLNKPFSPNDFQLALQQCMSLAERRARQGERSPAETLPC